ncbi:MAG TPA: fasciclin domain-containing protein [Chryseosolibacter sp.]|jgi:Secreted and surface protein containing fasciclin-like repeats
MKTNLALPVILFLGLLSCNQTQVRDQAVTEDTTVSAGQSAVRDDESQKNVVQTAIASPDHKTLVTALKAVGYVDALSNAGPFTVFAPNDAAFAKLPAGTVEDLLKPENKLKLQDILEYHVYVGVIRENMIQRNMTLNQVNGKNVTVTKSENGIEVNGAKVLAAVPTSNGIVYVIDTVLLPE